MLKLKKYIRTSKFMTPIFLDLAGNHYPYGFGTACKNISPTE